MEGNGIKKINGFTKMKFYFENFDSQKEEIDLMKYYIDYYDILRTIISEFDLLK